MMNTVATEKGIQDITMWITKDKNHDPRRYNLPIANEVAAVFVSEDGEPPFARDICVHPYGEASLQNINIISPNCDPMTYPLLFPHGEFGWQPGIEKKSNKLADDEAETSHRNVSMLQFYSYRLTDRDGFNPLLHAGIIFKLNSKDGTLPYHFNFHSDRKAHSAIFCGRIS